MPGGTMGEDDERERPDARPPHERDRDPGPLDHADLPVVPHQRAPLDDEDD